MSRKPSSQRPANAWFCRGTFLVLAALVGLFAGCGDSTTRPAGPGGSGGTTAGEPTMAGLYLGGAGGEGGADEDGGAGG